MTNKTQNITEGTAETDIKGLWIAGEVVLIVITIFTIYVFFSLLYYSWRRRNAIGVSGNAVEARERFLRHSCGVAIFMAIVRCALHQGIVQLDPKENVGVCRQLMGASKFFYNIAVCLMYVYFWLRQRNFYSNSDLKSFRNKCLEIVDWITLVLIIAVAGGIAIVAYIPSIGGKREAAYHDDMCEVFEYTYRNLVFIYAGLLSLSQLVLLGLYVYPLLIVRKQLKMIKSKPNQQPAINSYRALYPNIRRSLIMLVICIISDAAASALVSRLTKYYPFLFVSILALYDINLVIKVTCAICTFRNWRKIIFGFPGIRNFVDTREAASAYKTRSTTLPS